jgi:cation:H+ antiporter
LLLLFIVLVYLTIYEAKRESIQTRNAIKQTNHDSKYGKWNTKNILFVIIGLAGLALGAKLTVDGAVSIGRLIGLSEAVIALTIIALGTSLPELVTCIAAAIKGHHDISVGNLVGSNIFNTLLVIGAAGAVRPFKIEHRLAGGTDYWIMIAVSVAFALAIIIGRRVISRLAGILLLCAYAGYMVYLCIPA